MTALTQAAALTRFELRGAARSRWVTVGALVFAAAAVAAAVAGMRSFASLGLGGAGAATDGIAQVALLLPPLFGLLLGAGTLARDRERGFLGMLASQPVRRWQLPVTAFVGSTAAVWSVVALGIGAGALIVSMSATLADLRDLAVVLLVGLAAAAAAAALGVAISAVATSHQQATATAAALWLSLALGMDLLLAGVAPGLRLGPTGLLVAVVANPLEAARVLLSFVLDGPAALGPFGAYLLARLGRTGSVLLLSGSLVAWTVAPLGVATFVTQRREI